MHISGEDTPHHIASHGIGVSPLIEYLVGLEGDEVIKRVFDGLAAHRIALEAVLEGTLRLKLGPGSLNFDYVRILVFGLKDGEPEFLDEGVDFTVGDLEDYGSLVVAVVNSASEEPYTENLRTELDIRAGVSDWPWRFVYIVLRRAIPSQGIRTRSMVGEHTPRKRKGPLPSR
jgi:hypothetical protein